jgi:hypothetical protein
LLGMPKSLFGPGASLENDPLRPTAAIKTHEDSHENLGS